MDTPRSPITRPKRHLTSYISNSLTKMLNRTFARSLKRANVDWPQSMH